MSSKSSIARSIRTRCRTETARRRLLLAVLAAASLGAFFTPAFSAMHSSSEEVSAQSAGSPSGEEVRFGSGDQTLFGRLWMPEGDGPFPAMVFIPGSGRSISDLHLDPQPLPHRMAEDGIAFLAFDKRGVRHSEGTFEPVSDTDPDAALSRLRRLAEDAIAAMDYLRLMPEIDSGRVGVYAFSQGGWVTPLLQEVATDVNSLPPKVAVVVGGPAVTIGEENAFSRLAKEARAAAGGERDRIDLDTLYAEHYALGHPRSEAGGYGRPIFDPLPWIRETPFPSLWLLGERDFSVPTRRSVEILAGLEAIGRPIRHVVFPGADHGAWSRDSDGEWQPAPGQREELLAFLGDHDMLPLRISVTLKFEHGGRP